MELRTGDRVLLSKPHPCGSKIWRVARVGQDLKLVCQGCSREILISREAIEKRIKRVLPEEGSPATKQGGSDGTS